MLRLGQTCEVAAWETAHLRIYHLGNYPREVAARENVQRKVPNIKGNTISIIFLSHLILINNI